MTKEILSASVVMDDTGKYTLTVRDFENDTTVEKVLPDQYVSVLPTVMHELQRHLGD
ncbi:hypothetical protein EV192_111175 [Actinocrispum wychmicini]|uniref:Uncharacterized protein n=1 Tax=Actinocrispum wychmicini TaxID=1213861 RepID=A0A4R2J3C3_9PSEU|nr:hypothetical protein EV192_111175 [Actinocrispum wychmicini]